MTTGWTILVLIAVAMVVGIPVRLARRGRPPRTMYDHRRRSETDRGDPLHKRATDYLASGTLPRWDP